LGARTQPDQVPPVDTPLPSNIPSLIKMIVYPQETPPHTRTARDQPAHLRFLGLGASGSGETGGGAARVAVGEVEMGLGLGFTLNPV